VSRPLDPDDVALAALAGLPFLAWDRLAGLLEGRSPAAAWDAVLGGEGGAGLARAAASVSLDEVAAAYPARGVAVRRLGTPGYPAVLADDHEAPPVVFSLGSPDVLDRPRVAIVGTRRCTNYGREVARQLGRELAEAGVAVVSGLAVGIDGAAHDGALGAWGSCDGGAGVAPPVAVVGSGLDVVYPRRHAPLWQWVAESGLLLSEAPLGARPEPWRFPARNRIIAALAHVLVVVESNVQGGSMHTVKAAEERGVPVLAVPGPIKSQASSGANLLISQGCHPALDTADVLLALSLAVPLPAAVGAGRGPAVDRRTPPTGLAADALGALDWTPTAVDAVLARTGASPPALSAALAWLEREGWARRAEGWWERC
jgi:DNA processing protein